ncbi:hypothetical protein V6N13_068769 [Hibiscus sabdariffa]|uniref:Uncharacterized protein n=1 Tax=Hibiscus sabdariffa TaxID=183260 RepID=A0ABR2QNI7_9ROSI
MVPSINCSPLDSQASRRILHQHMLAVPGCHHHPMNVQTNRQHSSMGPPLLVRELDPSNRFAMEWRTEFGDKLMALVSFLAVFAHPMMPKWNGASVYGMELRFLTFLYGSVARLIIKFLLHTLLERFCT